MTVVDALGGVSVEEVVNVVLAAFCDVLETDVEVHDNFFALGGDSLAAMVALSTVKARLGIRVTPTAVLLHPTAEALAAAVLDGDVLEPDDDTGAESLAVGGTRMAPASMPQASALAIAESLSSRGYLSWVYQLNGLLDRQALARAVDDVVLGYEVLRTRFEDHDGRVFQVVQPFVPGVLRIVELDNRPKADALDAALEDIERWFTKARPIEEPELRAVLYAVDAKTSVFALFVAEALVDSDSGTTVAGELSDAYARHTGIAVTQSTTTAPVSYLDHVLTHRVHPSIVEKARAHWREQATHVPPPDGWPLVPMETRATAMFKLEADGWAAVARAAQNLATTPYVLVLACFHIALARIAGLRHLLVDSAVADRSDPASHELIGNFQVAVRVECRHDEADTFSEVVSRTARAVRDAVAHCALPAPLVDDDHDDGTTAYRWPAPIAFFMFKSHEGPLFPGVRRRRFRLSGANSRPLRLNCSSGPHGDQDFVFESTTASQELLDRLASAVRMTLDAVVGRPERPIAAVGEDGDG